MAPKVNSMSLNIPEDVQRCIRLHLALSKLLELVRPFAEKKYQELYDSLWDSLTPCSCSIISIKGGKDKCEKEKLGTPQKQPRPNSCVCGDWASKIASYYYPDGEKSLKTHAYQNVNPQNWYIGKGNKRAAWEVAKMFMGNLKFHAGKFESAEVTDVQNILSSMKNCRVFYSTGDPKADSVFDAVLKVRNDVLAHNPSFSLSEDQMQDSFVHVLDLVAYIYRNPVPSLPLGIDKEIEAIRDSPDISSDKMVDDLKKSLQEDYVEKLESYIHPIGERMDELLSRFDQLQASTASQPLSESILPLRDRNVYRGRDREIKSAVTFIEQCRSEDNDHVPLIVICGMAGVGKSTTALQIAQEIRDTYTDRCVHLKLRGGKEKDYMSLDNARKVALIQMGIDPVSIPEDSDCLAALYSTTLLKESDRLVIIEDPPDAKTALSFIPDCPLPSNQLCILLTTRNDRGQYSDLEQWSSKKSVSLSLINLSMLDIGTCTQFALEKLQDHDLAHKTDIVSRLFYLSEGHPLFLTDLCHSVTRECKQGSKAKQNQRVTDFVELIEQRARNYSKLDIKDRISQHIGESLDVIADLVEEGKSILSAISVYPGIFTLDDVVELLKEDSIDHSSDDEGLAAIPLDRRITTILSALKDSGMAFIHGDWEEFEIHDLASNTMASQWKKNEEKMSKLQYSFVRRTLRSLHTAYSLSMSSEYRDGIPLRVKESLNIVKLAHLFKEKRHLKWVQSFVLKPEYVGWWRFIKPNDPAMKSSMTSILKSLPNQREFEISDAAVRIIASMFVSSSNELGHCVEMLMESDVDAIILTELLISASGIGNISANLQERIQWCENAVSISENLNKQDFCHAKALFALAERFYKAEKWKESESLCRRAIDLVKGKVKDNDHPYIPFYLSQLGISLRVQGKLVEAMNMCEGALNILNQYKMPTNTIKYVKLNRNFSLILRELFELSPAIDILEKSLKIFEQEYGSSFHLCGVILTDLGEIHDEWHDYANAEQCLRRALKIIELSCGKSHVFYYKAVYELSKVLIETGRCKEAEQICREELERRDEGTREHHSILLQLGLALFKSGNREESSKFFERSKNISEECSSIEYLNSLCEIAKEFAETGRYDEAEKFINRIETLAQSSYAGFLSKLSRLYCCIGKTEKAKAFCLKANETIQKPEGMVTDVHSAQYLNDFADILERNGEIEEGEKCRRQALNIMYQFRGDSHAVTIFLMEKLAVALNNQGKTEEAIPLHRKAISLLENIFGETHQQLAISCSNLGTALLKQSELVEAESYCRRSIDIFRKLGMTNRKDYMNAFDMLCIILFIRGRYDEAGVLWPEIMKECEEKPIVPDSWYAMMLTRFSNVLLIQSKTAQAKELIRKAIDILERTVGKDHKDYKYVCTEFEPFLSIGDNVTLSVLVHCAECGVERKSWVNKIEMRKCKICSKVYYCSEKCRKQDRNRHKKFCSDKS